MTALEAAQRPDRWTAVRRGFLGRCPRCGQGRLFRSYLELSGSCASCGEVLGDIRAEDGPAWATILVVGHLTVPFFLIAVRTDAPEWLMFGVLLPATVALTAVLLPRFKGVFAAMLWSLGMRGGSPG